MKLRQVGHRAWRVGSWFLIGGIAIATGAQAQVPSPNDDAAAREIIRQQERERELRRQQESSPEVRLPAPSVAPPERLPLDETPCFPIQRIALIDRRNGADTEAFAWALAAADKTSDGQADPALGRCLGSNGISLVMRRIQNAIIQRGYVTTRVLAEPQDLKTGRLELRLITGRIRQIRPADGADARAAFFSAFPMGARDTLNLRDIEQSLENLRRVPGVQADIQLVPSEGDHAAPGDTDLVVAWQQGNPIRGTLTADDSGTRATGRYQGSATLQWGHLLALNDLFYITLGQDLDGRQAKHGTRSRTLHYSLPVGYWLLGATASDSTYHQSVAGVNQTYLYSGRSHNADLKLSRVVFRDSIGKTLLGIRYWERSSNNYIDDTEVLVQRRRMAGWEAEVSERLTLGDKSFDAGIAYRQGTGVNNSLPAPEEAFGEGTARPRVVTANAQINAPFNLLDQRFRYALSWRAQWNGTPLIAQDRFAIGGRYTIRGFDGESVLSAERGWLVRNDLGLPLGQSGAEAYVGVDVGRVGGASTNRLAGRELAGLALGVRGSLSTAIGNFPSSLSYDLFVGQPLNKPEQFKTAKAVAGFSLSWSF